MGSITNNSGAGSRREKARLFGLEKIDPCNFPVLLDGVPARESKILTTPIHIDLWHDDLDSLYSKYNTSLRALLETAWALTLGCYAGTNRPCLALSDSKQEGTDVHCHVLDDDLVVGDVLSQSPIQLEINDSQKLHDTGIHFRRRGTGEYQRPSAFRRGRDRFVELVIKLDTDSNNHEYFSSASLEFSTNILFHKTASNVGATFAHAISLISKNPSSRVHDLNLLSAHDYDQIKVWNNVDLLPTNRFVYEAVQDIAKYQPDALALWAWDGKMTFRDLDDVSTRLAHHLVCIGVGPEVGVVLCFTKTLWMPICMMAVLKAGGTCVPIDPSAPSNHHIAMIQAVDSHIGITDHKHLAVLDGRIDHLISDLPALVTQLPSVTGVPCTSLRVDNGAFAMFTSGSTGLPKGIIQTHEAVMSSAYAIGQRMKIDGQTKLFQFAAWTFDPSIGDIFSTWMFGGCVCLPSDEERIKALGATINRFKATHACLTPTVIGFLRPADVPTLQVLALGGEALVQENLTRWADHVHLINIYGPAECTIWCSSRGPLESSFEASNIGYAFGGRFWIVRPQRIDQLAPIGALGELLFQGPSVARGYINVNAETSRAFLKAPVWSHELGKAAVGERQWPIYNTGDLARYDSNGSVLFVGRRDAQVKISGQRIDLLGIEYQVKEGLGSEESQVVVDLVQRNESKILTAFVCLKADLGVSLRDPTLPMTEEFRIRMRALTAYLSSHLPKIQIPSVYILQKYIPTTSSAKIDRARLHTIAASLSDEELATYTLVATTDGFGHSQEVSTDVERTLQGLWAQTLGLSASVIKANYNFFQIGGDSVKAMRLVALAQDVGLALSVSNIFQNETLSDMAAVIRRVDDLKLMDLTPFSMLGSEENSTCLKAKAKTLCYPEVIEDIYPCTPLQEGLMAIAMQTRGAYLSQFVFHLPLTVDLNRFKWAWILVAEKVAIIRTRLIQSDTGNLYQVVTKADLIWETASDLDEYLERDAYRTVSLGGPLSWHAFIVKPDQSRHFIWTTHHAIYDGWSAPLIMNLVLKTYATGDAPPPQLFSPFIKYIQEIDQSASDEYWKKTLDGVMQPSFPSLPVKYMKAPLNQVLSHSIPLLRNPGSKITLATIIRAAWAMIVVRYSDTDDVVFGTTSMGRNVPVPGIDAILGPTIATIPVRVTVSGEKSVAQFLHEVQDQQVGSIPFEQAGLHNIRRLSPDARMACNFQNLLVIQVENNETQSEFFEKVELKDDIFHPYALAVECSMAKDSIKFRTVSDANAISASQVRRVLQQFSHVIKQLNSFGTNQKVSSIELISPEDMTSLFAWNKLVIPSSNLCAHEVIKVRMKSQPDAIAIEAWDGTLTYKELDQVSDTVAQYLIDNGVQPEEFVALCFEKSVWAVVAMIGVMKSGAAFVPLESTNPLSRKEEIIVQSGTRFLFACESQSHGFPSLKVVVIDETWLKRGEKLSGEIITNVKPSNPLYVIFTSGSTGKPKGFVIEHASFTTAALVQGRGTFMSPQSRIFQFSSYSFDVSVLEIITGLIFGACICIASSDASKNLVKAMQDMHITWACFTPSVARLVPPASVPRLKTLSLGGEAVSAADIIAWSERVQMIIGYGPSEVSVACTMTDPLNPSSDPENFGLPRSGLCWIVEKDDHNKLAPLGTTGEILIEGPTLARCYLNEPEKTAAAFIEAPKWLLDISAQREPGPGPAPDLRLYKTGDLGRFAPDGSIIFVARKDRMVKVRGQRVELSEVEHHFSKSIYLRHFMVDFPKSGPLEKKLVIVATLDEIPIPPHEEGALRPVSGDKKEAAIDRLNFICDSLANILPSYMIPTVRIVLDDMPYVPSGKINRTRISAWLTEITDDIFSHLSGNDEAINISCEVASKLEARLRIIWAAVLGMDSKQLSLDARFFRLGGDSLLAMRIMSICQEQGIIVKAQDILQSQTISKLAGLVKEVKQIAPEVWHESYDVKFTLSPAQQLYFDNTTSNSDPGDQLSVLLRSTMKLAPKDLISALDQLVHRHSILRARFSEDAKGQWTQYIPSDPSQSFRFANYHFATQQDLGILAATKRSINIKNGPVFAADLINIGETGQVIYLVAHRVVVDTISWDIIIQDLEQIILGTPLPPDSISFHQSLQLQSEYFNKEPSVVDSLISSPNFDYWGMKDEAITRDNITTETIFIGEGPTYMLLNGFHDVCRADITEILLAGLIHSFRITFPDREAPTIFNEVDGRASWSSDIDLSRTVGFLTTYSPVEVAPDDGVPQTIMDVLRRVKDSCHSSAKNNLPYLATLLLNSKDQVSLGFPVELVFNYAGFEREGGEHLQQFGLPGEPHFADFVPTLPQISLMSINVGVQKGCLRGMLSYNKHMRGANRMGNWIRSLEQVVEQLVEDIQDMDRVFSLSDFPLIPLDYENLDLLVDVKLPQLGLSTNEVEDIYPCTPMQQGVLVSQMKNPGRHLYQNRATFEVVQRSEAGKIDVTKLQDAWQQVISRHGMLRTIFAEGLCQGGVFNIIVLSGFQTERIHIQYDSYDEWKMIELPVKNYPEGHPPLSFTVCTTGDGKIFFELEMSHVMDDGVSTEIMLHDLLLAYDNRLEPVGPRFRDFIAHSQNPQMFLDAKSYYKDYLSGVAPCYFPTLVDVTNEPQTLSVSKIELGPSVQALNAFCSSNGVTLFTLFRLVWAMVLRIYTSSNEICFVYITSGRDIEVTGIQEGVGMYAGLLICRATLEDATTVSELLETLQTDLSEALPYQHYGLSDIQHDLGLQGQALANSGMSFRRISPFKVDTSLELVTKEISDSSEYDITVVINVGDDVISAALTHWNHKISRGHTANVAGTFNSILSRIVENPYQTVGDLGIFSERDQKQIAAWNSYTPAIVNSNIHDIIATQVALYPNSLSVDAWDGQLTYAELDNLSSRLAFDLLSKGVKHQEVIPLYFEKSMYVLVCMIAVIKTGGIVILLDPFHPISRLEGIIQQTGAKRMLTSHLLADKLRHLVEFPLTVDGGYLINLPELESPLSIKVSPNDIAYLVFTSGSTGKPKGIMIEHSAFTSAAKQHAIMCKLTSQSRVLQLAAFCFDASFFETFTAFMHGACVCMPSEDQRALSYKDLINDYQVTWIILTPSVVKLLKPEDVPTLKSLLLGGEAATRDNVITWAEKCHLVNGYGPAECSVSSNMGVWSNHHATVTNIGSAIPACRVWITDVNDHNKLVPVGVLGELVIQGPILARGYLGDAERTTASFIENPAWLKDDTWNRIYKTGDLVRYAADGSFIFVGRKDTQVKIRGQRVELGEIEHNILLHKHVDLCAVILPKKGLFKGRLIGVISLVEFASKSSKIVGKDLKMVQGKEKEIAASRIADISDYLSERVPSYMLPSSWAALEELPLSPTVKLDRKVLQSWLENLTAAERSEIADFENIETEEELSPMEERLQGIWSIVINLPSNKISVKRSFMNMGGDSIMAVQIVAACRIENVDLTIQDILRFKTISHIAAFLESQSGSSSVTSSSQSLTDFNLNMDVTVEKELSQIGVSVEDLEDVYPCSRQQNEFLVSQAKGCGYYETSSFSEVIDNSGTTNIQQLRNAWQEVVDRHASLRTIFLPNSSSPGKYNQFVLNHYDASVWLMHVNNESHGLKLHKSLAPCNYTDPRPRHRLTIYKTQEGKVYCGIEISHVIIDGTSISILLSDLNLAYQDNISYTNPLYKDYITRIGRTPTASASAYWAAHLTALKPLPLPSTPLTHRSQYLTAPIPNLSTLPFKAFCKNNSITLTALIHTIWSLVLRHHTNSNSTAFAYLISTRAIYPTKAADSDAIGLFIETLICRAEFTDEMLISDILETLQEDAVKGLEYLYWDREIAGVSAIPIDTLINFGKLAPPVTPTPTPTPSIKFKNIWSSDPMDYTLTLNVQETETSITAELRWHGGRMANSFVEMMAKSFLEVGNAILGNVEMGVWEVGGWL